MKAAVSLDQLNRRDAAGFAQGLAGVFEHAPWVVDRVAGQRPFDDVDALHRALMEVLQRLPEPALVDFLNLHPELAGSAARAGAMTPDSIREQGGLALGRLDPVRAAHWDGLNQRYRARFGFPFVLCIGRHSLASALEAFDRRLDNDRATEMALALEEIRAISRARLELRLAPPPAAGAVSDQLGDAGRDQAGQDGAGDRQAPFAAAPLPA